MRFLDLTAQYRTLQKQIDAAALRTLSRGSYILGREVAAFETAVASFCGTRYAIGVNSGTDALFLSLRALGIGSGDEVITTPFTFIATAEVIAACGARPVFADIDPLTMNIDPSEIEKKITKRTKAMIPVHLFGLMADMTTLMKLAKKYSLFVVEDAAQSFGAARGGRRAGSLGTVGCFSFFPSKNLGAYGDGGMIVTNNKKIAGTLLLLRSHGSSPNNKYTNLLLGYNSRLDEIQAALLHIKLSHVSAWNKKRQTIASRYTAGLLRCGDITAQASLSGTTHSYHQYTILTKRRDALKKFLGQKNIPSMIYYPTPLHLQPSLRYLGYARGSFPQSEWAAKHVLSLPLYPELSRKEQQRVIDAIHAFFKKRTYSS